MSYRRRHRWFRRLALGLAFATAIFAGRASVAAAKVVEGSSYVVIDRSATAIHDPYASPGSIDVLADSLLAAARPDDRADRFAHSLVASAPEQSRSDSTIEWSKAVGFGIGTLVLVLGLGLAVVYRSRPRLAGP